MGIVHGARPGRDPHDDGGHGQEANSGDRPERGAPAPVFADQSAERHAQHVGDRQPGEHDGDRTRSPFRRNHAAGDKRADAEERAVAQGGDDAAEQCPGVGGRGGGQQVTEGEQRHQPDEYGLAVEAGGGGGQQDRADRDAQGVSRK